MAHKIDNKGLSESSMNHGSPEPIKIIGTQALEAPMTKTNDSCCSRPAISGQGSSSSSGIGQCHSCGWYWAYEFPRGWWRYV